MNTAIALFHPVIVLATYDEVLVGELARLYPDLRHLRLNEIDRQALVDPLWCFIDWILPDTSGLEVCRRLRAARTTAQTHITLVLEDGEPESRRRALRAGANDYVVGPLNVRQIVERVFRVHACPGQSHGTRQQGALRVDHDAVQARYGDTVVPLRPNEFRLLTLFLESPDRVLSRGELIAVLGKDSAGIDERTVDVWVGRLRRGLAEANAPEFIRTVRQLGYVWDTY